MPTPDALLAFALASFVLVMIPGPSMLFVIGRSLSLGRRGGLLSVLGNELGNFVLVAAVALGVGSVVARSLVVFTVVKLAGAAYLLYLGMQTIRHRREGSTDGVVVVPTVPSSALSLLRQGFLVGVTNPKTIVFFVAVLPQFASLDRGHVPLQMLVLGAVFVVIAFLGDGAWALAAGTARAWFARSPKRLTAMRTAGGGMMLALGGTLVLAPHQG